MHSVTPYVLMIEDDEDDRFLTNSTLNTLGLNISLKFISRSDELFDFIAENGEPSLLLVDYNCTPLNGLEVVKLIRQHSSLGHIPVIVLSENTAESQVKECYRAGANSFISKPISVKGTQNKIETFFKYWFEVVGV
jgi:CheY-like chemotaxis protein